MGTLGNIQPPGPLTVAAGATPSFLITPSSGLAITNTTVDGTPVTCTDNHDGTYTYVFPPVQGNHTLIVSVAPNL